MLETRKTFGGVEYYLEGDEVIFRHKGKSMGLRPLLSHELISLGYPVTFYDDYDFTGANIKKGLFPVWPWERYIRRKVKTLLLPLSVTGMNENLIKRGTPMPSAIDEQKDRKEPVDGVDTIVEELGVSRKKAILLLLLAKKLIFNKFKSSRQGSRN